MLKNQCLTYTEKYEGHYENLQPYFRLGLKLKAIYHVLEFNQSQWLKPFIEFNTQSRTYGEQNNDKNEKALYKLTTNVEQCCIRKKIKNARNRINVTLLSNEKDYLKSTSKPSYM